jgi:hypothetical protein
MRDVLSEADHVDSVITTDVVQSSAGVPSNSINDIATVDNIVDHTAAMDTHVIANASICEICC